MKNAFLSKCITIAGLTVISSSALACFVYWTQGPQCYPDCCTNPTFGCITEVRCGSNYYDSVPAKCIGAQYLIRLRSTFAGEQGWNDMYSLPCQYEIEYPNYCTGMTETKWVDHPSAKHWFIAGEQCTGIGS
jgi:hypothetical protein